MNEQKKNDWLATLFFSPEKTPRDLANFGITTDNSELKDIDYYKSIPQIQESFKKDNGSFDEDRFTKYYQEALRLYNDADNEQFTRNITEYYTYDANDIFAPFGSKEQKLGSTLVFTGNPARQSKGASNLKQTSAPTMSFREVGQQNKVFNWDTQEFEDWTPNDWGGLKAITRPTLVLAQWDDDGEHEVNGRIVSHKKGDLKFNEFGDTYYETLGNREIAGKDILHVSDTLTVDNSRWNNYDFFDSDGLNKSVGGIITKTLFNVIPMFIPYVNVAYGGALAAKELGKLLPILFKSIEGIATGDISNSSSAQTATKIQAFFSRFDSSISDYGKQGFFTLENIGKLVADSSGQLWQQRVIGMIPAKISTLRHAGMISDNAKKWGQGMSLAYMAGTSSIDAYDSFKEAGASDRTAGLGMLSVMGAMFGLMNNDYFKEMWFKGSYLDRTKIKSSILEAAKNINVKEFNAIAAERTEESAKAAAKWVLKTKNYLTNKWKGMKPGDLMHDALNEGVEETMEEVSTDLVKSLYLGLNTLGVVNNDKALNFRFTPEDIASRYFTSFVGGALGGAVFSLHNKIDGLNTAKTNQIISDGNEGLQEIIYLIRNKKTDDLRKELEVLHSKGKLGSANLSATETEKIRTENGEVIQYKPTVNDKSQNDVIYKQLSDYIDRINSIINEENLNFSDEELASIALIAKSTNLTPEEVRNNLLAADREQRFEDIRSLLVEKKLYSQIFEDWNRISQDIIQTKAALEAMLTPSDTESKTPKDLETKIEAVQKTSEFQNLKFKLEQLRQERNSIINGERNDFYMSQLLFAANPEIARSFIPKFGIHNYTRYKYNKDYDKLTDDEKVTIDNEFENYTNLQEKDDIISAHNLFYKFQEDISKSVTEVASKTIDSSSIYKLGSSEFKQRYEALTEKLNNTNRALDEAISKLSDNEETSNEIEELRREIETLQNHINSLGSYHHTLLQPALSQNGTNILVRAQDNTELAYKNYTKSYIDFLDYINKNGLYLGLVDADLAAILNNWLTINDFKENAVPLLTSKIQEYLNYNDDVSDLIGPILDIINAVKSNDVNKIIKAYDSATNGQLLDTLAQFGEEDVNSFLNAILPSFGDYDFINYIRLIESKKRDIKQSPAIELIERAFEITGLSSNDIIEAIRTEQQNLLNSKNLEDYMIRNKESMTKLKDTAHMIDVLSSAIKTSLKGSYNSRINIFRESLNKELLSEIDPDIALSMLHDLADIKLQIDTLIKVSEENMQQKLREQQSITFNMRQKFVKCLTADNSLITKTFKEKFGIDTVELAKQFFIEDVYDYDDYDKFEVASIEFETALFGKVRDLKLSNTELASTLVSCFNSKDLIDGAPTKLSKNDTTVVTGYDQLVYIASILSKPSRVFYNELKNIISDENYKLAPIFSQEYAVRIADAFITNKDLFNKIILQISNLAKASDNPYLKTKSPLYNLVTVFGGAGVGKTTGVAALLRKLHGDSNILLSAPENRQILNLEKSIGDNSGKFTKNQLIEKIIGRPISSNDIHEIKNNEDLLSISSDPSIKVNTHNIFGDAKERILFIDEVSLYDRIELEIISKWAKENNVMVVCLGDYKQNESSRIVNNRLINSSINDCFIVKTPDLVAPLRPDNIAKYDNYVKLFVALSSTYDYYYEDTSRTVQQVSTWVEKFLKANNIEFKYYETNNSFGGEKIISESDIDHYITKFKNLSDDVVIITDRPEKYTNSGIRVLDVSQVQGAEFDYIIIDKKWDPLRYNALKDIYTLTQRSRKGTVINNMTLPAEISSKLDPTSAGNIELSENQISEFKTWRLNALQQLSNEPYAYEVIEDSVSDTITVKDINENITDNEIAITKDSNISNNIKDSISDENINTSDSINITDNKVNNIESINQVTEKPIIQEPNVIEIGNSNIKEVTKDNVVIPKNSATQIITSAETMVEFYNDALFSVYKSSENNLFKAIKVTDPNKAKRITYMLAYYYLNGFYKTDTDKENMIHNKIMRGLSKSVSQYVGSGYYKDINAILNSDFEFHIVPFNNKGLLVARINYKENIIDIPLLVTNPTFGKYNGDIQINSDIKKISNKSTTFSIEPNNFITSNINPNRLFRAKPEPIILSVEKDELDQYSEEQKAFINKKNNGNTFLLISTNPFISDQDFNAFLNQTKVDDLYTYTTQHDSTITLIGINWTADFKTFLEYSGKLLNSKFAKKDSIITGSRVSTILAIAYKTIPEQINNAVKYYIGNNNKVSVNDIVCSTYEEFINEVNKEDIKSIKFGYINANGDWIYDKGEFTLNRIFYKNGKLTINNNIIEKINIDCSKSSMFPLGIYGRDIRDSKINGCYYNIKNIGNVNYSTNIETILGNDYMIDISKLNAGESLNNEQVLLSKLNDTLAKLGYDRIITSVNNVQSVLDEINKNTLENLSSPNFVMLTFEDGNIISTNTTDYRAFAESKLKTKVDEVIPSYSSKFIPFFVSLQNRTEGYVIEQKDNNYTIRNFPLVNQYNSLLEYIRENEDIVNNNINIKTYLQKLMQNKEVDLQTAEDYYKEVSNYKDLQQKVNDYLIAKLETYEC